MAEWHETYRSLVFPWHCDHFGHMNARWYAHHFDDAGFHLWSIVGMSYRTLKARGASMVVAQTATDFIHELVAGDLLIVRGAFTGLGNRSVRHTARMFNADTDALCAEQRVVEVFFDEDTRTSAPMPDDVRAHLEACVVDLEAA